MSKLPKDVENKIMSAVAVCVSDVEDGYSFEIQPVLDILEKALDQQREGMVEERVKFLKRLKLETDVVVCDCGEKISDWDISILIKQEIDKLQNQPKEE